MSPYLYWAAVAAISTGLAPAPAAAANGALRVEENCTGASRCFNSVGAALASATADTSARWITIRVGPGSYREKLTIARNKVRLVGAAPGRTRLHFDAAAQTAGSYHRDGWGTAGSATLTIDAGDVLVEGITIENDFDYLANDRLAEGDAARIKNSQGVALLLDIHSDRVSVRHSAILGYQDTLFANGKRVHISDSLIAGNVDFIFGNGMVLIERSEIRSRIRSAAAPGTPFQSFIAAPSTLLDQPIGIVIYRSRLTREAGVPDGAVALARPWHPTTRFADGSYANPRAVGQASFIDCFMDAHIGPDHWTSMAGTAHDGSKTAIFEPQDARFFERGSTGPGSKRREIGMPTIGLGTIEQIKRIYFGAWQQDP